MIVSVVVDKFPVRSETFVLDQVSACLCRALDVVVVCGEVLRDDSLASIEKYPTFKLTPWWGAASKIRPLIVRWLGTYADKFLTLGDLLFSGKLGQSDVIVSHFGSNGMRVARLIKRGRISSPLITVFHGYDVAVPLHDGNLSSYSTLFRYGSLQLPVNAFFRNELIKAGADPKRVIVHHMGVRVDQIGYRLLSWDKDTQVHIISVCRLVEKKGIEYALRALAAMLESRPDNGWRYSIVGDGPLLPELVRLAENLGIGDRVSFLGPKSHAEVKQLLTTAHVFLLPSVTAANGDMEGIPVALMEAMAAGLIAVSTYHSGIPELIEDQVTGFLAPERDVVALSRKLAWIVENPAACHDVAVAAREKVETDFNAEMLNDRFVELVKGLVKPR